MADFEIRDNDTSYSDYIVTDLDSGAEYDVSVTHYGAVDITPRSRKASVLPVLVLWIAVIIGMPIIFFTEKIWQYESAPIFFIIAWLVALVSFVFTVIPGAKDVKVSDKFKKVSGKLFSIFMYLILVFAAITYFTLGEENCDFLFIYVSPIMVYGVILYHVKDADLIVPLMEKLKIKKYSFVGVYIIQWLIICVIFYFAVMQLFGDVLGEFLAYVVCYMYVIWVDIKKLWLRKSLF